MASEDTSHHSQETPQPALPPPAASELPPAPDMPELPAPPAASELPPAPDMPELPAPPAHGELPPAPDVPVLPPPAAGELPGSPDGPAIPLPAAEAAAPAEATPAPQVSTSPPFLTWEIAAYAVLLLLAGVLRFWDLGLRPIHYDESIHGMYSWHLARGDGYQVDPLLHGPLKTFGAAFFYKLYGVSDDYTTRILPALFGTLIVLIPILYRRYLGRWGSLAAGFMLALSPAILYFSRFDRDDIFMLGWNLLLVWCMWRYIEQPRNKYLFLASAVVALSFASMEGTFLSLGIFGLFLLIISARSIGRAIRHRFNFSLLSPAGVFLLLLATLSLPQWSAALAWLQLISAKLLSKLVHLLPQWSAALGWLQGKLGIVLANTDSTKGLEGIPLGRGLWVAGTFVIFLLLLSIAIGLRWRWKQWLICAGIFYAIYVVLFTTYFTNWLGFPSGMWRSFGYWFIVQQPKHRMDQPWFYYLMEMSIYEFLPLILGIIAGTYYLVRRSLFTTFLIYWAVMALVLYSYAGEKAPWLVLHVELPLILLAGKLLGDVMRRSEVLSKALVAAGFIVLLTVTGFRAVESSFQRSDSPPLLLDYAQVSFDVPPIIQQIKQQAVETGEGKKLPIVVDSDLAWPLMWYFRDYTNVTYPKVDTNSLATNPQVVLVSSAHNNDIKAYMDRYGPGQNFNVLTWFPEDYRQFKLRNVFSASMWKQWWDYAAYRKTNAIWTSAGVAYFAKLPADQSQ